MSELTGYTIVAMAEEHLDEVLTIERMSFPTPWIREHFLGELASGNSFPLVALDETGRVTGYICPMLILDEGHILNVAVHPESRGRGIGRLLVEKVLVDCRAKGASFIDLEVRLSNEVAISLYRQLGFSVIGRRKAYYENNEDALLMEYLCGRNEE